MSCHNKECEYYINDTVLYNCRILTAKNMHVCKYHIPEEKKDYLDELLEEIVKDDRIPESQFQLFMEMNKRIKRLEETMDFSGED